MVVLMMSDEGIQAFCSACTEDEYLIYEWEDTPWADWPAHPVHVSEYARSMGQTEPEPRTPGVENIDERMARALAVAGSPLSVRDVQALVRDSPQPGDVIREVIASCPRPPRADALGRFMPVLVDMWNNTPRPELGDRVPNDLFGGERRTKKVGRNEPCPCGSGKRHKKCCLGRDA